MYAFYWELVLDYVSMRWEAGKGAISLGGCYSPKLEICIVWFSLYCLLSGSWCQYIEHSSTAYKICSEDSSQRAKIQVVHDRRTLIWSRRLHRSYDGGKHGTERKNLAQSIAFNKEKKLLYSIIYCSYCRCLTLPSARAKTSSRLLELTHFRRLPLAPDKQTTLYPYSLLLFYILSLGLSITHCSCIEPISIHIFVLQYICMAISKTA